MPPLNDSRAPEERLSPSPAGPGEPEADAGHREAGRLVPTAPGLPGATSGPVHETARGDEFPPGASEWPDGLSRRQFLELMGASLALAGLGACNRPPSKTIVPYVTPPERQLLDAAVYYATAMAWEGYARGLLALSNSGRPTKLEGNPAHPDSLGSTDIHMQAAVLSLYDPDRSRAPRHGTGTTAWLEFESEWLALYRELSSRHGRGLAVLTEPTTSPTFLRGIHFLLERLPEARWYQHTPLARFDHDGRQEDYDFKHADIVLAIESDFLMQHPSSVRYARDFAARRRIEHGRVDANRLYVIEATTSLTGSMADHRLPASPRRQRVLLHALTEALDGRGLPHGLTDDEQRVIRALAADLRAKAPRVLCVAGETVDPELHAAVAALNARLGADGVTRHELPAVRSDGDHRCAGDLAALTKALRSGTVETLAILGANPVYTAPADLRFTEALAKAHRRIHLGSHLDETALRCEWHIPESHFLESWGDLRAYDGTVSIVQPLIAPMYESRSASELVFFLAEPLGRSDYDLVRETWKPKDASAAEFEPRWEQALYRGIVTGTANKRAKPQGGTQGTQAPANPPAANGAAELPTLLIRPDPTIRDGRWANHGWLQELPKPNTQLVWDNPAHISPAFARKHGLRNGDVIALHVGREVVRVPVWVAPGQAPDVITAFLGYGRVHVGNIGNGRGYDAYRLRQSHAPWSPPLAHWEVTGDRVELVSTHSHFTFEGRDIVRTARASNPAGTAGARPEIPPSLFPDWKYDGYRWGMSIDLGTCIGCKACVIACQAENNIPVVGKDQVARGREMHWIRVDQYYDGTPENPRVLHQPVPCMQCEHAPCEVVCPVAATTHSSEGLNDMVYNRCVGTRYCSNNCPYKVRRFNFLDYRPPRNSTLYLQDNPNVTVRARGVMEKCTYCVQRINAGRIHADMHDRRVRDGEIRTACQQACPTEAIIFGDINDPKSKVRARKLEPTQYALLEELNTRPRTTYLAKITNENEAATLFGAKPEKHA